MNLSGDISGIPVLLDTCITRLANIIPGIMASMRYLNSLLRIFTMDSLKNLDISLPLPLEIRPTSGGLDVIGPQ